MSEIPIAYTRVNNTVNVGVPDQDLGKVGRVFSFSQLYEKTCMNRGTQGHPGCLDCQSFHCNAAPPARPNYPTTILMMDLSLFENFSRALNSGAVKSTVCLTLV
jgi:hypothetical protein